MNKDSSPEKKDKDANMTDKFNVYNEILPRKKYD